MIYKGGIFNKVVHAEYKEKFKLQDQISFVFLGSKDDGCLVESIDTNQKERYGIKVKYSNRLKPLKINISDTKSTNLTVSDYKIDRLEKINVSDFCHRVKDADTPDKIKLTMRKYESAEKTCEYEVKIIAKDPSGNTAHKVAKLTRKV